GGGQHDAHPVPDCARRRIGARARTRRRRRRLPSQALRDRRAARAHPGFGPAAGAGSPDAAGCGIGANRLRGAPARSPRPRDSAHGPGVVRARGACGAGGADREPHRAAREHLARLQSRLPRQFPRQPQPAAPQARDPRRRLRDPNRPRRGLRVRASSMKPHSLVFRLAMLQQVLAAALIAVFAGSAVWLSARTLEREEVRFLTATARKMADNIDHDLEKHDDLERVALETVGEDAPVGVRVDVLDEQGRQVASTAPARSPARREETTTRRAHLSHGGWVVVSTSTRAPRSAISALILALFLTAIPLFIGVAAISRALARRALRPLSRMAGQAEQATLQGDLHALGHPTDPVEVATLATAFNRLLARVDKMLQTEREFTQDAAHELRTPLTVLSGELERASSDASLPAPRREGLGRAWDQARRMSELVEALLLLRGSDASAPERPEGLVPVNLTDMLREVGHELCERLPERAHDLEIVAA